jgi:hypothetical protein
MVSLWLGVVFIIAHMGFYMYVYWDYKVEIYKSTGFAAQAAERARDHAIQAKNNKPAAPPANTAERVSSKKDMIKAAHAALKTGFVRQSTLEQLALEKNTEAMAADKKVNISAGSVIAMVSKRERRQMTSRQRIAFVFVLLPACLILVITTIMSAAVSSSASGPASVIVLLDIAASVVAFIVFFTQNEFVEASSAELKANKFMQRHPPKSFSIDPGTVTTIFFSCRLSYIFQRILCHSCASGSNAVLPRGTLIRLALCRVLCFWAMRVSRQNLSLHLTMCVISVPLLDFFQSNFDYLCFSNIFVNSY